MTRKRIAMLLLSISTVLMLLLIVTSFTSYVPMPVWRMQNIYIAKILLHGIPVLLIQIACLILLFTEKAGKKRE